MEDTQFNKEVIIIGAGGLAREIVSWHNNSKGNLNTKIIGFLDDDLEALNLYPIDLKILGTIDLSKILINQAIIFAISDVETKKKLVGESNILEENIISFIHESCFIGDRSQHGFGLVLLPNALISCDVNIGNLVLINSGSQIGHDVIIGNFTSIMANVDIGGDCVIGSSVFIGSGAIILPGVKIPNNTRIGAGAVVLKSLKEAGTYFGNPAKRIF